MSMPSTLAPSRRNPHTRWPFTVLFGALGSLVVAVVVLAFVWPAATAKARDLPVGIGGPSAQVSQLKAAIAEQSTHPFRFVSVSSRADAVHRIRTRELYGAVLLGSSPEVLTSSAASSVANQALRGVATGVQTKITASVEQALITKLKQAGAALQKQGAALRQQGAALRKLQSALQAVGSGAPVPAPGAPVAGAAGAPPATDGASAGARAASAPGSTGAKPVGSPSAAPPSVRVTDVVALSSDDSTGGGLTGASFPLVLGGMLGGVLVSLLVVGVVRRLLALLVYGAAAGTTVTLVLQTWLHVLQRDWLANAAAFGLAMLATAAVVVGFNALLGPAGIGVGAVVSLLVGNPISGATLPYQFIAAPWGDVGQYFVPGAASSLVRSLSYFPEADVTKQWLVLGAWALGGMLLTLLGHFRSAAPVALPAVDLERDRPRERQPVPA